jgi:hypothetical protein
MNSVHYIKKELGKLDRLGKVLFLYFSYIIYV